MWAAVARLILRNRGIMIAGLGLITALMAFFAREAQISYDSPRLLGDHDTVALEYSAFKKRFGQDGAVMTIGIPDSTLYSLDLFLAWYDLTEKIRTVEGVKEVLSLANLRKLVRNDSLRRFDQLPFFKTRPASQAQLDSLLRDIRKIPLYKGMLYNDTAGTTLMLISFDNKLLNTKNRLAIVDSIRSRTEVFAAGTGISPHYSGMPYIRSAVARMIQKEMSLFMLLALAVTALILLYFFRSLLPVVFSIAVVFIGVIWSVGILVMLGYHVSVLSGLIPPLLVVIGIPNCIMLLNKYHTEYGRSGNKISALRHSVEKVAVSLFLANITTAIGFAVFCAADSQVLFEFGLIASVSVMLVYLISLILIPILFSYLPPPSPRHTRHLQSRLVSTLLKKVDHWVHHQRPAVYAVVMILLLLSGFGLSKVVTLGYLVDDLPKKDPVLVDLKYFEKNYGGVIPFEIAIDTKKENGVFADGGKALYRINRLQKLMAQYPQFSRPYSITEAVKLAYQAYSGGSVRDYRLPGAMELQALSDYRGNTETKAEVALQPFVDKAGRHTRVSYFMQDVGTLEMRKLLEELKPRIDSVFNYDAATVAPLPVEERYRIVLTGNSVIFLQGNAFLVENLLESVLLAVILIAAVLYSLFMSPRMILVSVIPSLIPLLITAGIMGYFQIHIKPSTILVFSIAFGIASDGTLYFLTKYRQELRHTQGSISKAVSLTIRETGVSMIYTAIILFCGFGIFAASSFGGTAALGILISVTLLIAYCSNLVLLPCILLSLEKKLAGKDSLQELPIDSYMKDTETEPQGAEWKGDNSLNK